MSKYFLSRIAEQDIDEIITYIAQENPKAAMKFLDSLYESMSLLVMNPQIGHRRTDITDKPVLFWSFKWHYLIIYKNSSPMEIVRILSGYRDIAGLLVQQYVGLEEAETLSVSDR